MNKPLPLKITPSSHELGTRTKVCKALVLAIMIMASVEVVAQVHSMADITAYQALPSSPQKMTLSKSVKLYACPMHPDVQSAKGGKCPKCGMDLRLTHVDANSQSPVAERVAADRAAVDVPPAVSDSSSGTRTARKMQIPDVEVLDQNGNELHFYSDLIKGKTVAINFIFTNCTTICPPLAATFARVQKDMGDKVGRDVHFISISVDPLTDTPERLKAWGAKFKAGDGWTFVTGTKQEMDKLLSALGASVGRREDHTPSVIIGNEAKGIWTRTYGLAKTTQMVALIQDVIDGKTDESLTKETTKP